MATTEINFKVNLSYGDYFLQDNDTSDPDVREGYFVQFIFWGVVLPIVGLFGFFGNLLTIIVLWRREMQSTTTLYLRVLVITDSIIIVGALLVLTPYSIADHTGNLHFKDVVYPLIFTPLDFVIMTAQSCNVWVTVSVTTERYIAICHPFRAQNICTRKKAVVAITSIIVLSVLYNIPRLFATETTPCPPDDNVNITSIDGTVGDCYVLVDTTFGQTFFIHQIYRKWMYLVLVFVIPLADLFVLNVLIIKELMRMRRRRGGSSMMDDENEANISVILVLIVIVFIVCQTPGLISQFDIFTYALFLKWLAVSNTLLVLNSSVNFLIYTAVGKRFRKTLFRIFGKLTSRKRRSSSPGCTAVTNGFELSQAKQQKHSLLSKPQHV